MSPRADRNDLRKGLILVAVGGWFLMNTLEIRDLRYWNSWPLLLILIGVAMTIAPDSDKSSGPALIGWGVLFWVAVHNLFGFSWTTIWPLVIVMIGVSLILGSLRAQRRRARPPKEEGNGG